MSGKKSTNASVAKPMVEVPADSKKPSGFYRLKSTPRGIKLFTYTIGAFMAIGVWNARRKVFQPEDLTRFFQTKKVYQHHKAAGNFEETKTGARMTVQGWNYFSGRLTGSTVGQKVHEPEAKALAEALKTGKLKESTANYTKSTDFIPILK